MTKYQDQSRSPQLTILSNLYGYTVYLFVNAGLTWIELYIHRFTKKAGNCKRKKGNEQFVTNGKNTKLISCVSRPASLGLLVPLFPISSKDTITQLDPEKKWKRKKTGNRLAYFFDYILALSIIKILTKKNQLFVCCIGTPSILCCIAILS